MKTFEVIINSILIVVISINIVYTHKKMKIEKKLIKVYEKIKE